MVKEWEKRRESREKLYSCRLWVFLFLPTRWFFCYLVLSFFGGVNICVWDLWLIFKFRGKFLLFFDHLVDRFFKQKVRFIENLTMQIAGLLAGDSPNVLSFFFFCLLIPWSARIEDKFCLWICSGLPTHMQFSVHPHKSQRVDNWPLRRSELLVSSVVWCHQLDASNIAVLLANPIDLCLCKHRWGRIEERQTVSF